MPAKYALIIANSEYQDKSLSRLTTPEKDADEFARLLREQASFSEVQTLKNAAEETMRRAIARFFANRSREDLLLLYFSGHGLKNDRGKLFLAARDTDLEILDATAVPAEFIAESMNTSRSQRQTLILDCCNSGAFARGMKGAGMGTAEAFQGNGYGRVVLTATDAVQYAWEGHQVIGEAHTSLFTHFLIEGLQGPADLNGDGKISVNELYEYVYKRVVESTSRQTPKIWDYGRIGEIFLRENLPPLSPRPAPPAKVTPQPQPPRPPVTPAPSVPRDQQIADYNDARALQHEGKLAEAADLYARVGEYRDAPLRLRKLQLYLEADKWMKAARADKDERPEPWLQARACLEELLQLDPNFLDALARLTTVNRWIALPETYDRLLSALDVDDWAQALPLFEEIRRVKANYKRTQSLFESAWPQMVEAGVVFSKEAQTSLMIFVPAGEFLMGSEKGDDDEKPPHTVYLDDFYIDRYPVTNAEYKKFVEATGRKPPSHWENGKIPPGKEAHPVVNVSWQDAAAYAEWAGKRLPTEAEWEKAASWDPAKREKRVYPWGNRFDAALCNSKESGIGTTTPVGKYSPQGDSPYGVADMAGNVWEWCADWYDSNYYKNSPKQNPKGPKSGQSRVLRGGSWDFIDDDVRASYRDGDGPTDASDFVGFRCSRSLP